MTAEKVTLAQASFTQHVPTLLRQFRYAFRRYPYGERHEKIQDATAAAWSAWIGLIKRGVDPVSVGVTGIAANSLRYVRNGRKLGTGTAGRGSMDIFNPKSGCRTYSMDQTHDDDRGPWSDWMAADTSASPADQAAMRIDFHDWLGSRSPRDQHIFAKLADGERVTDIAKETGLTSGRISQMRVEARKSWEAFVEV
jgi:hypothetical protein